MFSHWKKSNDLVKYCIAANCTKIEVQKNIKSFNTSENNTQITKAMRYSQLVRK